ncbi:hypothetical protein [Ferrimonas gelatinilytica]|uniref:DJ-1/PfpI domain-containing protein n=1 Tax=Ferrimonas gelatinilytica TaxID=1255257 RepID=A0ABP9S7R8_9GAMM
MATLLFVTDTWGQHATLDPLLDRLKVHFEHLMVLDPYSGQRFAFDQEADARAYFDRRCSAAVYQDKVRSLLLTAPAPLFILALGAGADATAPLLTEPDTGRRVARAALGFGQTVPAPAACPTLWLSNSKIAMEPTQSCTLKQTDAVTLTPRAPGYDAAQADLAAQQVLDWLCQDSTAVTS